MSGFLLVFLLLLRRRNVQQIVHIGLDIVKLLHIRPGLLIGGIGFPFLFQQTGVFLSERFDGGQFCDSYAVKIFLRRLV